jgi:putative transposase
MGSPWILGWRVSATARPAFAPDALEQLLDGRGSIRPDRLIHPSDQGLQHGSIRYAERLAEAGHRTPHWIDE